MSLNCDWLIKLAVLSHRLAFRDGSLINLPNEISDRTTQLEACFEQFFSEADPLKIPSNFFSFKRSRWSRSENSFRARFGLLMRFIDEKTSIKSCFIFYNLSNKYASRENAIKALRSLVKHLRTTHGLLLRTSSLSGVKQTLIKKSFFNCRSIVWSCSAKRESVLFRIFFGRKILIDG